MKILYKTLSEEGALGGSIENLQIIETASVPVIKLVIDL